MKYLLAIFIIFILSFETILSKALNSDELSLKISIFSGLKVENLNYMDLVKADTISVEIDYWQLLDRKLVIESLSVDGLEVSEKILDSNGSSEENENSALPFLESIELKNLRVVLKNFSYQKYKINSANLELRELLIDKSLENISLKRAFLDLKSSVANSKVDATFANGIYSADVTIENIKEFENRLNPIKIALNGDFDNLKAKISADGAIGEIDLKSSLSDIELNLKSMDIRLSNSALVDTKFVLAEAETEAKLNLNRVDETLIYNSKVRLKEFKEFDRAIRENNITIKNLKNVNIDLNGDLRVANAKIYAPSAKLHQFVDMTSLRSNLKYRVDRGSVDMNSTLVLDMLTLNIEELKLENLKEYSLKASIEQLKDFGNFNLSTIDRVDIVAKGDEKSVEADILSKVANIEINSSDLNSFSASIDDYLDTNFTLKPLNSSLKLSSLISLREKLQNIYTLPELEADLRLTAKEREERVELELNSTRVALDEIEVRDIGFRGSLGGDLTEIKDLNFELNGLPVEIDKRFVLNREVNISKGVSTDILFNRNIRLKLLDTLKGAINLQKFKLKMPEYADTQFSTDLVAQKLESGLKLSGEIELFYSRFFFELPKSSFSTDSDIVVSEEPKIESSDELALDLKIISRDNLVYKTEEALIEFSLDLAIKKELRGEPKISGAVEIKEGTYNFKSKEFSLESSEILFTNSLSPLLNIRLVHTVDDIEIYIDVAGSASQPEISFSSSPSMPKKDIMAYLITGKSFDEILSQNRDEHKTDYQKKALILAGGVIAEELNKELDLDKFELNDDGGSVGVEVGKRINRDVTVSYKNSSGESSIVVEYEIDKNIGIQTEVGGESNSLDIFYKRSY